MSDPLEPFAGKTSHRDILRPRTRLEVPAGGFIERFEVHSREGLLPNTDARNLYTMVVELYTGHGDPIPCDVTVVWREVATAQELLEKKR